MRYAAILFDLDGTLVNTIDLYEEAVATALASIQETVTPEQFRDWYIRGLHLRDWLKIYGRSESEVPDLRARRDDIYRELLRTGSEWLPGAEEVLRFLKPKIPMAIVTGSWMSYVDAIDEKLHLRSFIETFVTADEIHEHMKPEPDGLLLATKKLNVDPKKCLYVGDQGFDVEAARNAHMPCCIVEGKWTAKGVGERADIRIDHLNDLKNIASIRKM